MGLGFFIALIFFILLLILIMFYRLLLMPTGASTALEEHFNPLSIAFVSKDGTIREIKDMEPFDKTQIKSKYSTLYALEVNQGAFQELGVEPGDEIIFPPGFH